ncbi:cytochrome c biogenesis protein ResB [Streptomyces sp. MST-110588]|uniref:cytochrome c biogenesis protein ResB n=1 Tax=Streptomyces sp. MST-110588 TaxID=2833628 RepID=UPI001F5C1F4F|nr:cytochrome c biogenesis protein ResB [Streptomyces sp. MST-110588]UNO41245.1 cytochrome c biogenesis protein ResB [Streptomyces sp. MST-110588]
MSKTDAHRDTDPAAGPAGEPDRTAQRAGEEGLTTAPKEEISLPALGPVGWARWFWRQLTSMRVALILLFLLSIGAIPGSLVPQVSIDPVKVDEFKAAHSTLGPLYDKLGLFHVYSSVWFSAIYILLFISLIGCIVPRTWQFVGQLRGRPPAAPRRLNRMPAYATWRTDAEPEQVVEAARRVLKQRRFRTQLTGTAVASEKGYLREAGNLLFHIALIVMLVAFASGSLWKSEGGKLITEGDGFSNSLTQYDDYKSGALFDTDDLAPFSFTLDRFTGTYERSGPQKGTPRTYRADVTYREGAQGADRKAAIEVNKPLEVMGTKVYLDQHGYSPIIKVKDGRGKVVYDGAVPFLPTGPNVSSSGVVKVPGAKDKNGRRNQLGIQGFFVPTYAGKGKGTMFSQFPAADFPVLNVTAYHGDLNLGSGLPQNVYQLDTKRLEQYKDPKQKDQPLKKSLLRGESLQLPNGDGSIEFSGLKEWASFKISHQPGNGAALAGAVAALLGLAASLFIQRRRVWVRAEKGADGVTVVELAGLGRSETARLPEELAALAGALSDAAPVTTEEAAHPASSASSSPDDSNDPDASAEPADPADPADPTGPAGSADPSEGAHA